MEGKHFKFTDGQVDDRPCTNLNLFGHWYSTMHVGWDYLDCMDDPHRAKILPPGQFVTHWVIDYHECPPQPISSAIQAMIKEYQDNGQMIDHILIDSDTAGRLWLEGKITREIFHHAIEDEDSVSILVEFNGWSVRLIIRETTDQPFVIMVSEGRLG